MFHRQKNWDMMVLRQSKTEAGWFLDKIRLGAGWFLDKVRLGQDGSETR